MDRLNQAISTRRSVRKFSTKPVTEEQVERLLRAGMQAPSAHNLQPWEFLVLRKQAELDFLSGVTPYTRAIARSAVAVLVMGNLEKAHCADDPAKNPFWPQDLSAAVQNMLLQAAEEGLGGLWMGLQPQGAEALGLREHYHLPQHLQPFCLLCFGWPETSQANHFVDRWNPAAVHYDRIEE